MVIDDLDIERIAILEMEAHAPLVVDANAPLPCAVKRQRFQPV